VPQDPIVEPLAPAAGTSFESHTPAMCRSGWRTTAAATTDGETAAHFIDAGHVHEPDAAQRVLERAAGTRVMEV
jgi:hypothetical protein